MTQRETGNIEIKFLRDFAYLDSAHPALLGVGLVCFDAENVVVPYKRSKVLAGYADQIAELHEEGINTCMLSNMTDSDRAEDIAGQLGTKYFHKEMGKDHFAGYRGLPSKTHPEIYQAAIFNVGMGSNGPRAIMVDDQLKNIRGASQVPEFSTYFWTYPNGLRMHPGVALGRLIEVPVGFGKIAVQNLGKIAKGTHEEF